MWNDVETEVLYDRVDIRQVEPMNDRQYYVRGCTALLDAVGGAIRHIGNVHRYARPEDVPEKTLFIITTDGMENASRFYSYEKVRNMIEKKKEEEKWEFLFFGANIDAVKEAGRFGIRPSRAVTYEHDRRGTSLNYEVMSRTVSCARAAESQAEFGAFLDEDELMAPIREDYRRRHGKN